MNMKTFKVSTIVYSTDHMLGILDKLGEVAPPAWIVDPQKLASDTTLSSLLAVPEDTSTHSAGPHSSTGGSRGQKSSGSRGNPNTTSPGLPHYTNTLEKSQNFTPEVDNRFLKKREPFVVSTREPLRNLSTKTAPKLESPPNEGNFTTDEIKTLLPNELIATSTTESLDKHHDVVLLKPGYEKKHPRDTVGIEKNTENSTKDTKVFLEEELHSEIVHWNLDDTDPSHTEEIPDVEVIQKNARPSNQSPNNYYAPEMASANHRKNKALLDNSTKPRNNLGNGRGSHSNLRNSGRGSTPKAVRAKPIPQNRHQQQVQQQQQQKRQQQQKKQQDVANLVRPVYYPESRQRDYNEIAHEQPGKFKKASPESFHNRPTNNSTFPTIEELMQEQLIENKVQEKKEWEKREQVRRTKEVENSWKKMEVKAIPIEQIELEEKEKMAKSPNPKNVSSKKNTNNKSSDQVGKFWDKVMDLL